MVSGSLTAVVILKNHPWAVRGKVTVANARGAVLQGLSRKAVMLMVRGLAQDANQDQYDQNDNDGI
jgi:hypothetical protein